MGVQRSRKAPATSRSHRVTLRGIAELPASRVTEDDRLNYLTADPIRAESAPGVAVKFPVYEVHGKRILIPKYTYFRQFYDKRRDKITFADPEPEPQRTFVGKLWPEQVPGMKRLLKVLGKRRGVTGKGRCGTGKTVMGVYLMSKIAGKCVVMVDQTQIADQWVEALVEFLRGVKVTFVMPLASQRKICKKHGLDPKGREKIDLSGDVVVVMAQTAMRLPKNTVIPLSLLIVDEAHSFSAPSFAGCIFRFSFKYSVGFTATDERPDGLEWIFKDILGPTTVTLKGRRMEPVVATVSVTLSKEIKASEHKMFWCNDHKKMRTYWACKICDNMAWCQTLQESIGANIKKLAYHEIWARLCADDGYNNAIIDVIRQLYKAKRNILVLAKFKAHLRFLRESVIELGVPESDTALYFGGMDKDRCLPFPITFATFGIAYKALNAKYKDAEVLAMPVSNVEQPAGRVEREAEDKKDPIIVDFVIQGAPFLLGQFWKRRKFYDSAGYKNVPNLAQALTICRGI